MKVTFFMRHSETKEILNHFTTNFPPISKVIIHKGEKWNIVEMKDELVERDGELIFEPVYYLEQVEKYINQKAFIITTSEKEFLLFAVDEDKAIEEFKLSKGRKIIQIVQADTNQIYELE